MRGLGLEDKDFDYVKSTLAETLVEFKLTPAQVAQAAAVVESTREAVRRTEEPATPRAFLLLQHQRRSTSSGQHSAVPAACRSWAVQLETMTRRGGWVQRSSGDRL